MAQAERINTGYLPSQIPRLTASRTPILLYKVKPADTLSQILVDFYDAPYGSPDYLRALTLTQYVNPELSNPNVIFPGQVIRLYCL